MPTTTKKSKFEKFCKKHEIPLPLFNARELEHLNDCVICKQLWILHVYHATTFDKRTVREIGNEWITIPEVERRKMHKRLRLKQKHIFTKLYKQRLVSAYDVYRKEQYNLLSGSFSDRQKLMSEKWHQMTNHDEYIEKANRVNINRLSIRDLPKYMRKMYKSHCEVFPKKKRTPNIFMNYISSEQRKKKTNENQTEFVKRKSQEWRAFKALIKPKLQDKSVSERQVIVRREFKKWQDQQQINDVQT